MKEGTGTLAMNASSKAWTGETHIDKGVLQLNGDYTMRDGEVLAVAVNDGANDYGKLIVKGTADIKDGTLRVKASDIVKDLTTGNTPKGEWKDVITADTLNTQFKAVNVVDKAGAMIANNTIEADYTEANKVHLRVTAPPITPPTPTPTPSIVGTFTDAVNSQNNTASLNLAQVLDVEVAQPTVDNANLVTALTLGVHGLTTAEQSQGISELLPLFMGATLRMANDHHSEVARLSHERFAHHAPHGGLWANVLGSKDSHAHENSVAGYETDRDGVVVGADGRFGHTTLGVAVAYQNLQANTTDTVQHTLDSTQVTGLIYANHALTDSTTLTAHISLGQADITGERHLRTLTDTIAKSDYQASTHGASLGVHHRIGTENRHISPFVRLDYHRITADAYTETGAGVYNLSVAEQRQDSLKGTLGVQAKTPLGDTLSLTANAALALENGDRHDQVTAQFASTNGTTFITRGHRTATATGAAGVGLTYSPSEQTSLSLGYQGQWRDNYQNQGVALKLSRNF
ncbi:MAG: autotransporter outer membrane beta-barrel domain-containing protein [Moraxella sp.]|nr:autotransporter outer membrane beta-barrel domain-containing protein [Moraxella sp.]